jgi:arylsulfatase A
MKNAGSVFALGVFLVAHGPASTTSAADVPKRPNLVIILADDLGYGDLGCYNPQSKIPTPNLDRFATQGLRFTDAHTPAAVCTPTRYGLLTGRYCWRTRLKSNVLVPWDPPLIEPDRLTLPALLKRHGYATTCLGKWHLGFTWPTRDGQPPKSGPDRLSNVDFSRPIGDGPTTRGFDSYFGVDLPNYPPYCFLKDDRTVGIPSMPSQLSRPGPMLPGWDWTDIMPELTRHATNTIEAASRARPVRPFFLYLPLTAPHFPVVPSPEFQGKSGAGEYGDFVAQVDWTVGQVLSALERTGLDRETLVIFTSDNGPEITGEVKVGVYDRIRRYGHASMGPLRGAKRDLWEGGHRVPFLARWPGTIPAGQGSEELIVLTDLMATCAAILGDSLPDNAGEDSVNILPALLGGKVDREFAVFHGFSAGKLAIRQGDWVLIDAPSGQQNAAARGEPLWFRQERGYVPHDQPGELYNLRDDLAQRHNRFAEKPELVARLKALLGRATSAGRTRPPS